MVEGRVAVVVRVAVVERVERMERGEVGDLGEAELTVEVTVMTEA